MVELIGDVCVPSELILPVKEGLDNSPTVSGAMWVSGAVLCWSAGGVTRWLSGAAFN